jgi:CBS domain-containing protein
VLTRDRSPRSIAKIPVLCREIMKRPVRCIHADASVQVAARIMRDTDVGFVPVLDERGAVVGVLTDRDLATRICAEDLTASRVRVANVMTRGLVSCRPDDRLVRALASMRRHRLTRILITDPNGVPVGVLSLSDVAQYIAPSKIGRTLQTIAERKYAPKCP